MKGRTDLGFAESDPSLDVKGFDAKFKLTIAIPHTFGLFLNPDNIINIGIQKTQWHDLKYAKENNYTIKLIARAFKQDGKLFAFVIPQFIPNTSILAAVRNENNAVLVEGAFAEKQVFIGKGAGSYPTGSAVLSDISALSYDYRYEYKKNTQGEEVVFTNDVIVDAIVSFPTGKEISSKDFENFKGGYQDNANQYLTGSVKLAKLKEWSEWDDVSAILAPELNLHAISKKELVY